MKLPFQIDLTGKVVVVTGAGGVICSVLAEAMADRRKGSAARLK